MGTPEGAKKAVATIKAKHGEDFFKRTGAKGGLAKSPGKGFGGNKDLAVAAGRIGGVKSGEVRAAKRSLTESSNS